MDVFEAIYNRHSQGKVRPGPLPRELIEKLLEAAVQAPGRLRDGRGRPPDQRVGAPVRLGGNHQEEDASHEQDGGGGPDESRPH